MSGKSFGVRLERWAALFLAYALLSLSFGCGQPGESSSSYSSTPTKGRRFGSRVVQTGYAPVDLSPTVKNPEFVETYPSPLSESRAEVHANRDRDLAKRVAKDLYEAACETGRIVGFPVRGAVVLHLVSLCELPKSYFFSVTYVEGDAGMAYAHETAFFYPQNEDPLARTDALGLRADIFNTVPHELTHRLIAPCLDYDLTGWRIEDLRKNPTKAPRWLEDGIAEYVAKRVQAKLAPDLAPCRSADTGRKVLRTLGVSFLEWPDAGHSEDDWGGFPSSDCYDAALLMIETLLQGDDTRLPTLLEGMKRKALRNHEDVYGFIRKHLDADPRDVVKRF